MALTLRYAVRSDLGLVRGNNEDSVYAGPRLLAIADGMGGHAAGEVASKIVIGTMEPLDDDRVPGDLIAAMRDAVLEANHRIADAVEQDRNLDGMGTTLTALRFAGAQVALVHVGDSRAYLVRGNALSQITHDDTYVQYLVDSGKLTEEEAKDHPRKSVILRALRGAEIEPDVSIRESRAGDRYLLCSDGLSDVVSTETIFEALHIPDPQDCADRLVELALRSGGPDNVTVDRRRRRRRAARRRGRRRPGASTAPSSTPPPARRRRPTARPNGPRRSRGRCRPSSRAEPAPRRRRWRTPVLIVGILVVIALALGGTYAWAQTQYYVGTAGDEVAIYRGVNASFGPLKFSEVYRNTDLNLDDLTPAVRSQVESGITARSLGDAQRIVTRLHGELKPVCAADPDGGAERQRAALQHGHEHRRECERHDPAGSQAASADPHTARTATTSHATRSELVAGKTASATRKKTVSASPTGSPSPTGLPSASGSWPSTGPSSGPSGVSPSPDCRPSR